MHNTKVDLTWDDTDPRRLQVTQKRYDLLPASVFGCPNYHSLASVISPADCSYSLCSKFTPDELKKINFQVRQQAVSVQLLMLTSASMFRAFWHHPTRKKARMRRKKVTFLRKDSLRGTDGESSMT